MKDVRVERKPMKITADVIREMMAMLAEMIERDPEGDVYWPLFERLERELASFESRGARLHAARAAFSRSAAPAQTSERS